MPPAMLQPYDPTRGLISCFNNTGHAGDNISDATARALHDLVIGLYEEAFRRLPVDDVPVDVDLANLVDLGGVCLGLLNTLSLLPNGFETIPSTPATSGKSSLRVPPSSCRGVRSRDSWRNIAWMSCLGLLEFTQEQAGRYLIWARADLAMAVLLVQHDLYAARPAALDPRSGRTRNSLQLAAKYYNHPWQDQLVSLATAWLPQERLEMVAPILRHQSGTNNRLTLQDIKTVLHVFRHQEEISPMTTITRLPALEEGVVERTTSCADLGDGRISYTTVTIVQRTGDHIASLRRPQDMDSMLSSYSTDAAPPEPGTTKWPPQESPCASVRTMDADATTCPYVRSLEMSLYGVIHGFYLRALAMLPSHAARLHVRGVLLAGCCYGPMDPVSNIILSAVWYDINFPLPDADRRNQVYDILDALTMLRAVSRSLRGLVTLLHTISGQQLPLHEILKYLSYAQCDFSVMLQPHLHQDGNSSNPFTAASTAARHPQSYSMAAFFASLALAKLDRLRSLMMSTTANNAPLSQESLTLIYSIITEETLATMMPWQSRPPILCNTALSILARKRQVYNEQQRLIRGRIEQLLQEYARGHPSEPKYDLNFICGVALAGQSPHFDQCYHINFIAATKSTLRNTLFFAEFWGGHHNLSKTTICCPLPLPCDMGRCYFGRKSARKIAYPDHSIEYFSSDITHGGLDDMEGTLDTDFLYFDSERDVERAKELQRMAKQQDFIRQQSPSTQLYQWNVGPVC